MSNSSCMSCASKINASSLLCPNCGKIPIFIQYNEALKEMTRSSEKLIEKVNTMRRDFVISKKLDHNDDRNKFLNGIATQLGWVILQTRIYDEYTKDMNQPIPQWIMTCNPNIQRPQIDEIIINLDTVNRISYFTNFMFLVDAFLSRLTSVLPEQFNDKGYKKMVKHILKQLDMTSQDNEYFRILYFPAMVRNALHSHGIHVEDDNHGKIHNIMFRFSKNQPIEYSSWRHLNFFSDKLMDVIRIILENKQISEKLLPTLNPTPRTY